MKSILASILALVMFSMAASAQSGVSNPSGSQLTNGSYAVYDGAQQIGSATSTGAGTSNAEVTYRNDSTGKIYTWDGSKYVDENGTGAVTFGYNIGTETWYWSRWEKNANGTWDTAADGHLQ